MNCLIENDYIKGTFQKKTTYVFPNELPNWKRLHKGNFPEKKNHMYSQMNCLIENDYIKGTFQKKKSPMYSQMNCLIENDYIKGTFQKKNHLCIPKWIAQLKTIT